ncbi:Hcp family type VI secretion system effector [Variovorax sp. PAMC26660]|jgi:type VI secretion system secreted protein Hcp|uniref:Hcp family type VI secretion system effector n=1 Tax=Variovorax sp. PAMC26660 TaxID=2762322 RepID=UPI00164D07A2|nr:type VI secretion system tube protein Hcp [Variovorax sp. PAMC26660]QNK68935.1 type VI secretion system tube protein Hcp [Variovorax sp. PAMC26660]
MAIYIKFPGITGQTQVEGHKDELEVSSFSFGAQISVTSITTNKTRTLDKPNFSDISLSRYCDSATPQLLQKLASGEVFKGETIISFTREDNGALLDLIVMKLTDAILSSLQLSSGGDPPSESLSLNYSKIEIAYKQQKKEGGPDGVAPFVWNVATNTAS